MTPEQQFIEDFNRKLRERFSDIKDDGPLESEVLDAIPELLAELEQEGIDRVSP